MANDTARSVGRPPKNPLLRVVEALASLKFTVVLFAMAIFIVLAGTFAQTRMGNWQAVDKYFRTDFSENFGFTYVEFDIFAPKAFFPDRSDEPVSLLGLKGVMFPGGWVIGLMMCVNLLAAHGLRFKVQAKGERLWGGIGVLVVGVLATWLVVASGDNPDGKQASMSEEFVATLWYAMVGGLAAVVAGAIYGCLRINRKEQAVEWWTALVIGLALAGLLVYILSDLKGLQLKKESMRILWQLVKGQFAATVLLLSCWMLFKKRAGVVLLHGGIGLLMVSELLVGLYAEESQMQIFEGDTRNYSEDSREVELAFVDPSGKKEDLHVVVPESRLRDDEPITHPDLPFVIEPVEFFENTGKQRAVTAKDRAKREDPDDYRGFGKTVTVDRADPHDGLTSSGSDMPAAVVRLKSRDGKSLGTWLFALRFKDQQVVVDGKTFSTSLRYARKYHPYSVHLVDAEHETYVGAPKKAKDYSSYVRLHDPDTGFTEEVRIYMNNPLRYRGETLYQSGMDTVRDPVSGREMQYTVLQVVTNQGWMLPYVSCMIVMTGMLVQFLLTLTRFLDRREREARRLAASRLAEAGAGDGFTTDWSLILAPAGILALAVCFVGGMAFPKETKPGEMAIRDFGRLPLTANGRVKPMDSYARNTLVVINEREGYRPLAEEDEEGTTYRDVRVVKRSRPAVEWLLTVATDPNEADTFPVFRIVNTELLKRLNLDERPGFFRYSYAEILAKGRRGLGEIVESARGIDNKERTNLQRKAVSLYGDMTAYFGAKLSFWDVEMAANEGHTPAGYIRRLAEAGSDLEQVAFAIPSASGDGSWEPYAVAAGRAWLREYAKKHDLKTTSGLAAQVLADMKRDGTYERSFADAIDAMVVDEVTQFMLAGAPPNPEFQEQMRARIEELLGDEEMLANPPAEIRPQIEQIRAMANVRRRAMEQRIDVVELRSLESGFRDVLKFDFPETDSPYYLGMKRILDAYRGDEVDEFSTAVADYRALLEAPPQGDEPPREYEPAKADFETWFNGFAPFWVGQWLYLVAFVLAAAAWLGWSKPLNAASFWLIVFTLVLHTFAIVGRIYISGRPPVTNLYSSAVFIAWGCAVLGIVLELVFRLGIGNAIAGAIGFVGLGIAHFLSRDGEDTVAVMEAVLDTNIWLATHVVTVTLGYATTFVAGFFGLAYVFLGVRGGALVFAALSAGLGAGLFAYDKTGELARWGGLMFALSLMGLAYGVRSLMGKVSLEFDKELEGKLTRMIYGTLCFAIFFSFVGTVLGGLWADDSWGRFWGWDPKENGALIIVLWNALVLHARWDGMVKNRGLAMLAVAGNITTAWSWFGTNELGAGLHSYGFTDGVRLALALFVASQLVVIGMACLPKPMWRSEVDNDSIGTA